MIIVDRLVLGGLRFVLDTIAQAVDRELGSPERHREALLEAQLRHELGEIDDAELAAIEADLLDRVRGFGGSRASRGPISFEDERPEVEIAIGGDVEAP